MLLALVLHRCVALDAKLAACVWHPTTALPELLGVEETLQDRFTERLVVTPGGVVTTSLDLTDARIVGRGPPMSRPGRTKEGLYREKVGIALLRDAQSADMLRSAPVVVDRATGRVAHIEEIGDAGIPFLTALRRPWAPRVPLTES